MSAPTTRDPLVVNTKDGVVWQRRAVTAEGRGLYAVTGSCSCPEFLMATLAELAEHGIVGSADVLPMPVGPQPHPSYDELTERQKTVAAPGTCGRALATGKPCPDHPRQQPFEATELERLRARVAELEAGLPVMQKALFKALDRVSALEAERHTTNEALDDAVQALRAGPGESEDAQSMVYRASHNGQLLGLYSQREDALHHCEDALGRADGYGRATPFSWETRADGSQKLFAWTSQDLSSGTGFTVAQLEVRPEFDAGWGADADEPTEAVSRSVAKLKSLLAGQRESGGAL